MANPNIKPGPGRPAGVPNKATYKAREAIAAFVELNAPRMQDWLDMIAAGVRDPHDPTKWLQLPAPSRAFDMLTAIVEYHIPKLNRTEVTGPDGGAVQVRVNVLPAEDL